MKCPYCNKRHPAHYKFCPEYGQPLSRREDCEMCLIVKPMGDFRENVIRLLNENGNISIERAQEAVEGVRLCFRIGMTREHVSKKSLKEKWATDSFEIDFVPSSLIYKEKQNGRGTNSLSQEEA